MNIQRITVYTYREWIRSILSDNQTLFVYILSQISFIDLQSRQTAVDS